MKNQEEHKPFSTEWHDWMMKMSKKDIVSMYRNLSQEYGEYVYMLDKIRDDSCSFRIKKEDSEEVVSVLKSVRDFLIESHSNDPNMDIGIITLNCIIGQLTNFKGI